MKCVAIIKIEKNILSGVIISYTICATHGECECIGWIDHVKFLSCDTARLDYELFDAIVESKIIKKELKREMIYG